MNLPHNNSGKSKPLIDNTNKTKRRVEFFFKIRMEIKVLLETPRIIWKLYSYCGTRLYPLTNEHDSQIVIIQNC
jgi:hypothetical protein